MYGICYNSNNFCLFNEYCVKLIIKPEFIDSHSIISAYRLPQDLQFLRGADRNLMLSPG